MAVVNNVNNDRCESFLLIGSCRRDEVLLLVKFKI